MVSHLVTEDKGNRMSEEEIVTASEGPDVSVRVEMETWILRPTTAQMVLGAEALFLPDDHPLLCLVSDSVAIQGCVVVSSDSPALTCLEMIIHMANNEVNALVTSLMTGRADSLILERVSGPVILPDT